MEDKNISAGNITAKEEKTIKGTIKELLEVLEIDGDFEMIQKDGLVDVVLNTNNSGMVIGYHGEILESLQLILSLIIAKKIGRFVRISLEVDNYKKNRTEWLKNLTLQAKERALLENQEIPLSGLKSWERRVVHLMLQEDNEVMSESTGEGRDRVLVIKPR